MVRAWDRMIGPTALEAILQDLAHQYGWPATNRFIKIYNFAISDAWNRFGRHDLSVPWPGERGGRSLARRIVRVGRTPAGEISTAYFFGRVLSPPIYSEVAGDIAATYGSESNIQFHLTGNAFLSAVARQVVIEMPDE
jgi:hypothetical protein